MAKAVFNIIEVIISTIISIVIIDIGAVMLKEFKDKPLIGALIIILGFLLLYFSFYTSQIKTNQDDINDLKEEIKKIKEHEIVKEKILNTMKEIIMLEGIRKMNKRGRVTSSDVLEIIKIIIAIIVGIIIIKVLLSAI